MVQWAASAELAVDLRDAEKACASLKKEESVSTSTGVVNSGEEDTTLSVSRDNL